MRLIHLTDPHFGKDHDYSTDQPVLDFIHEHMPELIVVTGDIITYPDDDAYRESLEFFNKIDGRIEIRVIPGNHDCLMLKDDHLGENTKGMSLYTKYYKTDEFVYFTDEILVIGVNSNIVPDQILEYLDEARLRKYDYEKMLYGDLSHSLGYFRDKKIEEIQRLSKEHEGKFKIIGFHQHIIPIDINDNHYIDNRNMLYDAGRVLRLLFEEDFDMVLHGHRHLPRLTRVENICICSGGSSGCKSLTGPIGIENSIYLIDIGKYVDIKEYLIQSNKLINKRKYPNRKHK